MTIDQSPESVPAALLRDTADPEAPFGRKPDGTPYKRDPGPFSHLRGRPFGSLNGSGKAPTPRAAATGKPVKRASVVSPPKDDATGYAKRFKRWFQGAAKFTSRRAPVPAAIIAVRSEEMAEAWGRVAVSYPKVGRMVDRIGKGGDLSDAIGATAQTLLLVAHVQGLTAGTPFEDLFEDLVAETLDTFATSPDFAGMRDKAAKHQAARQAAAVRAEVVTVNGHNAG